MHREVSGKQTLFLHWRGWWAGTNLPYFRSQIGNSLKRQRWPRSMSDTSTMRWPSSKSGAGHLCSGQGSARYHRANYPAMQGIIRDARVVGQVFLCLTVLLAVFFSSYCCVWGNQENKVWPSGHLQEQLCNTDTCASQGWHQKPGTKQHGICISEYHWYTLSIFHTRQKKKAALHGKNYLKHLEVRYRLDTKS